MLAANASFSKHLLKFDDWMYQWLFPKKHCKSPVPHSICLPLACSQCDAHFLSRIYSQKQQCTAKMARFYTRYTAKISYAWKFKTKQLNFKLSSVSTQNSFFLEFFSITQNLCTSLAKNSSTVKWQKEHDPLVFLNYLWKHTGL